MQTGSPDPFGSPSSWPNNNPYAPPTAYDPSTYDDSFRAQGGTYAGGFAAGFIAALIGLLLVHWLGKPDTKRGAMHGFLARIGLVVFVAMVSVLFG